MPDVERRDATCDGEVFDRRVIWSCGVEDGCEVVCGEIGVGGGIEKGEEEGCK